MVRWGVLTILLAAGCHSPDEYGRLGPGGGGGGFIIPDGNPVVGADAAVDAPAADATVNPDAAAGSLNGRLCFMNGLLDPWDCQTGNAPVNTLVVELADDPSVSSTVDSLGNFSLNAPNVTTAVIRVYGDANFKDTLMTVDDVSSTSIIPVLEKAKWDALLSNQGILEVPGTPHAVMNFKEGNANVLSLNVEAPTGTLTPIISDDTFAIGWGQDPATGVKGMAISVNMNAQGADYAELGYYKNMDPPTVLRLDTRPDHVTIIRVQVAPLP